MKNLKGKTADTQLKKRIIKFFIPFVMLLMIIIIGTAAWFTMNKEADATGMGMRSTDYDFELAGAGETGKYDDMTLLMLDGTEFKIADGVSIEDVYEEGLDVDGKNEKLQKGYITADGKTSIKWALSKYGNLHKNMDDNNYDLLEAEEKLRLESIEPGDFGVLEFYFIPKRSGRFDIDFSIDLKTYKPESSDSIRQISSDSRASRMLINHLMFFESCNDGKYSDYLEFSNGKAEFSKVIENADCDKAYEYKIYWVWPYLFGQTVLPDDSIIFTPSNNALFASSEERANYIEIIKNDFEDSYDNSEKSGFFYGYSTEEQEDIISVIDSSVFQNKESFTNALNDIVNENFNYHDPDNIYSNVSYFWNKGDQYIGTHIGFITAELFASTD